MGRNVMPEQTSRRETNGLKRVSVDELQQVIAEAVSRLLGEQHTANITNLQFTNLGATMTMTIEKDIASWLKSEARGGGTGGAGGPGGGPSRV
jgi:hypothetical protein